MYFLRKFWRIALSIFLIIKTFCGGAITFLGLNFFDFFQCNFAVFRSPSKM